MKLFRAYFDSFKGLSKEVWWLSLITLINRAGTMVIPFLSLYLTEDKSFSLTQVAWIMTSFGLGSVCGSWLGGFLNDRIGSYKTMLFSLFSSGILFVLTQYANTPYAIAALIFAVMLCADIFRPAMFVALRLYSKPENQTRSVSLIRLAINLGFSAGPALGGILIYQLGYASLFWVDGITCIGAMFLLLYVLHPKRAVQQEEDDSKITTRSPYTDSTYLLFCLGMLLFGFVFLQYFSTVPLFYRNSFHLSEEYIGLLMGFNGLLVFFLEMPIIHYFEKFKTNLSHYILFGLVLLLLSFLVFQLSAWIGILWLGMLLMSIGEIFVFPFSNSFAMRRAKGGKMGQYMALYSISFSLAHIFGHNIGLQLINFNGYTFTWWIFCGLCILAIGLFLWIGYRTKEGIEQNQV